MLGILDSGIAGLAAARRIMAQLPDCDIVYLGDSARAPYGDRSPQLIRRYAFEGMQMLLSAGAGAVVIVSHTIACIAGGELGAAFDVPVLDPVAALAARALAVSRKFSFGVIGSRAVVDSNRYAEAILGAQAAAKVYAVACPLLAALAAQNWLKKPETVRIAKKHLHPLKVRQIDTLILGGAAYTSLRGIIQRKIGKRVSLIDAADILPAAAADFIAAHDPAERGIGRGGRRRFLVTDLTAQLARSARRYFNGNIDLTLLEPDLPR